MEGRPAQQLHYLRVALDQAENSPPKPTNFRVGAVLLTPNPSSPPTETTGYTLECRGNTHAEHCCFLKYFGAHPDQPAGTLPAGSVLYTTMEPCNKRSPGNKPCVDRILELKDADGRCAITTVYVGVFEPEIFVDKNRGRVRLEAAGVDVVKVECGKEMEKEILRVSKAGHVTEDGEGNG